MNKAVAKTNDKFAVIKKAMIDKEEEIRAALPSHMELKRFNRVFETTVRGNDALLRCEPASLLTSMIKSAQLGLHIDGVLGHAYMIPFGKEAQLIPGYKGLLQLVRQSGDIQSIDVESVFDGDYFRHQKGEDAKIEHYPDEEGDQVDDTKITHVYVIVKFKDGGIQRSCWPRKKIEQHKERYSKNWRKKDSAWQTAWEKMAKKTVLRDLCNSGLLPLQTDVQAMVNMEMKAEVDYYKEQLNNQKPTVQTTTDMHLITDAIDITPESKTVSKEIGNAVKESRQEADVQETQEQAAELFSAEDLNPDEFAD